MIKLVQLKHGTDAAWWHSHYPLRLWESGGEAHSKWEIFCKFLEKNGYFNAIWITFCTFLEPFERTKFFKFETNGTNPSLYLQVKSKTCLKSCILGLTFVTWPGQGNEG